MTLPLIRKTYVICVTDLKVMYQRVLILAAEAADAVGNELEVLVLFHGGVYHTVRTWLVPEC